MYCEGWKIVGAESKHKKSGQSSDDLSSRSGGCVGNIIDPGAINICFCINALLISNKTVDEMLRVRRSSELRPPPCKLSVTNYNDNALPSFYQLLWSD